MWFLTFFLYLHIKDSIAVGIVPPEKANISLQIQTQNGFVQGSEKFSINGARYFSYLGIPYAKPPINAFRFRSPVPMPKWRGVLDATVQGPCCAGLNLTHYKAGITTAGEEDCLYLNVFTPKTPSYHALSDKTFPVMVFFYGGAFFSGCAAKYKPDFFIENEVIVVIPNFRLSIFGFLSTEDLECPGNWASKDQIAVLKWIRANIQKFGGDPNRVTIFGQSAGGVNVNTLLLSPKAKGLFHRAIMMSGSNLPFWSYQTQQRRIAFDVGLTMGIETNSSKVLIEELRKIDTNTLKRGQLTPIFLNFITLMTNGLPLTPSIEPVHKEAIITDYPYSLMQEGKFNRVPVMIGVTNNEGAMFRQIIHMIKPFLILFSLSPGSIVRMTKNFKDRSILGTQIFNWFLKTTDFLNAKEDDIEKFYTEDGYFRPMRKTASLLAKYSPVYFYEFTYEGQLGVEAVRKFNMFFKSTTRNFKGVGHTEDLGYLFAFDDTDVNLYKKDMKMVKKLSKIYTNFAKTGNPTPVQDPFLDNVTWPKITPEKFPYLNLGHHFTEVWDNFDEKNYQFWNDLFNKYGEKPYKVY